MWWPLTLTYIFKVIRPWLWKSCLLCNIFSSWKKNLQFCLYSFHIWHKLLLASEGVSHVMTFDLWPWPIFSSSFGSELENHVRSVESTVLYGFFPYLVQMITSMRRCVACDDLWPWPISSRSFYLDFENPVRSVTFSVLDRLFPYLPQIITTITGYVAC